MFIKLGQWLATRKDLFPPDFCQELGKLHSEAPTHPLTETKAAVLRAFGRPIEELFDEFSKVPVASGSIGQVHRAKLSARGAALTGADPGMLLHHKTRPIVAYILNIQMHRQLRKVLAALAPCLRVSCWGGRCSFVVHEVLVGNQCTCAAHCCSLISTRGRRRSFVPLKRRWGINVLLLLIVAA